MRARSAIAALPIACSPSAFPDPLTLIAPRHPERGGAIAEELQRRSAFSARCARAASGRTPDAEIYICDTMGELGLFYRLAGVVFVGKSFVGGGGQNPIEPAKLASAILHGPHVANFPDVYAVLDAAGGAVEVARRGGTRGRACRPVRRSRAAARDGARRRRGGRAPVGRGRADARRARARASPRCAAA